MKSEQIASIRKDYTLKSLELSDCHADPIVQFEQWFGEAVKSQVIETNAFNLATIGEDGAPNNRVMLLKGIEDKQLVFYTNYESKKGQDIAHHPQVSLCFFWPELERQVRVKGVCNKTSARESDEYFASRPYGSRIGAWVSNQSRIIESREVLNKRQQEFKLKFKDQVPRPAHWGGYAVLPHYIEFWQGRASRLHDRICYRLSKSNEWIKTRVSP